MRKIILIYFSLITWNIGSTQSYKKHNDDPCEPKCNVYLNDISKMRCPNEEVVAKLNNLTVSEVSFNPDYVKLGGPLCGDKAAELLKKFRDQDQQEGNYLRRLYCSALSGWTPTGPCVHGAPPPCCKAPVDERPWKEVGPGEAMRKFKDEQQKVYQDRLRQVVNVVKPCRIQSLNESQNNIEQSYSVAIDYMNRFKEIPEEYVKVQSNSGKTVLQLKKAFDEEYSKGDKADGSKLKKMAADMKQQADFLKQLYAMKKKPSNNQSAPPGVSQQFSTSSSSSTSGTKITESKSETKSSNSDKKSTAKKSSSGKKEESKSTTPPPVDPKVFEMRMQYDEQKKKDDAENVQMGAALGATAVTMLAISDKESEITEEDYELGTYLKAIIGVGWDEIPVVQNMEYNGWFVSQEASTSFPYITAGFNFAAFNSGFISLKINPSGYYGMNAFDQGTTGDHYGFGVHSSIGFGRKFKVMALGEWYKRSGGMTIDNAVNFSDSKGVANYDYSTLKYGVGLQFRIDKDWGSEEFQLSAFKEQLSFAKPDQNEVYSFRFQWLAKIVHFEVNYAVKYPSAGDVLFPQNYLESNNDLYGLKISVPLTLFSN